MLYSDLCVHILFVSYITGAYIYPYMRQKFGIVKAGTIAICTQFTLIFIATMAVDFGTPRMAVILLSGGVVRHSY
jgi:hypothetical protein